MSENWRPLNIQVNSVLYAQVNDMSKRTGLSKAQIVRFALQKFVKEKRLTGEVSSDLDEFIFDEE